MRVTNMLQRGRRPLLTSLAVSAALSAAAVYHIVALSLVFLLVRLNWLGATLAYAMLIPLAKLVVILLFAERYEKMKLSHIGLIETALFIAVGSWIGLMAT